MLCNYSQTCLNRTPFGIEEFVQFRQVFGLHRFKLHRHLVEETVKSVWVRQVYSLLGFGLERSHGIIKFNALLPRASTTLVECGCSV